MHNSNIHIPGLILLLFRIILYICAVYFLLMGVMLIFFPQVVTKNAGVQHPLVLGILRGAGGSVIISAIFYILIALKPYERRWAAYVIALANILAVALDLISVSLGEYTLSHAMIDIPIEVVSFLVIVIFYSRYRTSVACPAAPH
jgi:hypothetical protein